MDCHVYAEDGSSNFVNGNHELYRLLYYIPEVDSYLGEIYQDMILSPASQKTFTHVFVASLILPENEVLVYHCNTGKDHTRITMALVLKGPGVDGHIIVRGYLLTNELYTFRLKRQLPSDFEMIKMVDQMNAVEDEGTVVKGITQTIDAGYDGFENCFMKELGFSEQDLKNFRKLYLE